MGNSKITFKEKTFKMILTGWLLNFLIQTNLRFKRERKPISEWQLFCLLTLKLPALTTFKMREFSLKFSLRKTKQKHFQEVLKITAFLEKKI